MGFSASPSHEPRVRRVALTGGIATGKSHVRQQFEELGVPTIDADVLARAAVEPGTAGLAAVVRRFGAGIVGAGGGLDRQRLAKIVFADADARRALENIIHPEVQRAIRTWFAALDPGQHAFGVADIPLLYEVGREDDFDAVIVAACAADVQRRRLIARDGLSEAEAEQRLAAQLPIDEKVRRADYVIRTDGSIAETNRQVIAIWEALRAAPRP